MGRKLYVNQKKALMAWIDEEARKNGWDGVHSYAPLFFPADGGEIPYEVYDRVQEMNPWESFHHSAVAFCQDYSSWRYRGNSAWQWRRDNGIEGKDAYEPLSDAEALTWAKGTNY